MDQPPPPPPPPPPESPPPAGNGPRDPNERNWAVGCHLAAFAGLIMPFALANILGPLAIWLFKRESSPLIDEQGKESLNFQITMTIYMFIAGLLIFVVIGFILLPAVIIFDVVMVIIAAIKTSNGEPWRYPLTIRLIT